MKHFEDIIKKTKQIVLTDSEREVARERVRAFIARYPVRKAGEERLMNRREHIPSPYGGLSSPFGSLFTNQKKLMPMALILALLIGGGTSFAAEQALPGDALYPVKVNVNEEVRSLISLNTEAKAAWDVRRTERRLEEAEKLLADGGITDEERATLEERIAKYSEKAEERAQKMEAHAAAQTLSDLEGALAMHGDILEKIREKREDHKDTAEHILEKVRERAEKAQEKKDESEADVERDGTPQSAAEGRRTAAINKIAEVEKFIARYATTTAATSTPTVATSTLAAAQVNISDAKVKVAEGDTQMTAGEYGKAFIAFGQAHRLAQEAKMLMIAGREFDIEFRVSDDRRHEETETGHGRMFIQNASSTAPSTDPSSDDGSDGRARDHNKGNNDDSDSNDSR